MYRLLAAPLAEFIEFNFALNLLLVLMSVVITPLTDGAAQRDEIVRVFNLCHIVIWYDNPQENATLPPPPYCIIIGV